MNKTKTEKIEGVKPKPEQVNVTCGKWAVRIGIKNDPYLDKTAEYYWTKQEARNRIEEINKQL